MTNNLPLAPEMVSTFARDVDVFYYSLVAVSAVLTLIVALCVVIFSVKYRRRPGNEIPVEYHPWAWLETGFIVGLTVVFLGFFVVGAKLFFTMQRPPDNALNVYATGKQWMWKFQHINGQWEINSLHVPVGRPVKLTMASEDVIHSFFVPAFRVKRDVLPSRFTEVWFEATRTGEYHLFCTEYCGTEHSRMIGKVVVMEPAEYQAWLDESSAPGNAVAQGASPGETLFNQLGCQTCHQASDSGLGPQLAGVAGHPVVLSSGQTIVADDDYLRESILNPSAKIVEGFAPVMPSFDGQVTEAQIQDLLTYIKTLSSGETTAAETSGAGQQSGSAAETEQATTPQTTAGSEPGAE